MTAPQHPADHDANLDHRGLAAFFAPYRKQWETLLHILRGEGRAHRLFGIERIFLLLVCFGLLVMPAMVVRGIGQIFGEHGRRLAMEIYAIAKPVLLFWVLFSGHFALTAWAVVASVALLDLYISLLAMVFLKHFHTGRTSHGRSLLLLVVNFAESVVAFAVLYGFSQSIANQAHLDPTPIVDPFTLLYFSCVTAASVGYGDYLPMNDSGKLIAIFQILSSMGFIFILLTSFVTSFNEREPV